MENREDRCAIAFFTSTRLAPFADEIVPTRASKSLYAAISTDIAGCLRERRGVSADTAMRLARYFGGDARSWLNLQAAYDLRIAEIENAKRIEREIAPATA